MLISFDWLKNYVKLPDSIKPEEVAEKLKLATVEVEKVEYQGEGLQGVVVGEILEINKHPNADKLFVAKVNVGEEKPRQVIFGQMAKMEVGYKVPVAKAPTILPGNKAINKGEIRGELSEGMLCLDQELGLLKEGVSIHYFDKSAKNGTPITAALGFNDAILEIDNKSLSNRPDLWGHYGMAREVAALFNREVKQYEIKNQKSKIKNSISINLKVEDTKLCPRYMAVAISGVKIGESPEWLKQKLMAVGLRPINNIVDITNYVMLDIGQPMHAFDASKLTKNKEPGTKLTIKVRHAKEGEDFTTLDEKKHKLSSETLVVVNDEDAPVLIPGVMGGLNSGIKDDTTTIVFESANFDAATIRRTSAKLGIRSDSSVRFEKSLDPNMCPVALAKAIELTLACCPNAKVTSKIVDEKNFRLFTGPLEIPFDFFAKKLGVEISAKTIIAILRRLGFGVVEKKKILSVKIPSWRATKDIAIAEDIAEEAARIYGYDNIPASLPTFPINPPPVNELRRLEHLVGETLVRELGYTEVYNYSFVSAAQINKFGDDAAKYLELNNPLSKEKPYLRRYLVMNLLENVKHNIENYPELKIFEIGKKYIGEEAGPRAEDGKDELLPRQDSWLTAIYVGKKDLTPFWQAKRAAEAVAHELNISWEVVAPNDADLKLRPWEHPARAARLIGKEKVLGYIYEVSPKVCNSFGIEERVGVFGLNLSLAAELFKEIKVDNNYKKLSGYPEVIRDVAFLLGKNYSHAEVQNVLLSADSLITKAELFDVYEGNLVAYPQRRGQGEVLLSTGKKSMAYHITYARTDRTLTSAEVDEAQAKVEKMLQEKFGAEIRS